MIDYVDTIEIRTGLGGERTDLVLCTDDGDLRDAVSSADLRRRQCTRVVALGEDDVLKVGRGSRSDLFEDHKSCCSQFVVRGSSRSPTDWNAGVPACNIAASAMSAARLSKHDHVIVISG